MEMVRFRTRVCVVCGVASTLKVVRARLERWLAGEHVQHVFPDLDPAQRELLISGTHPGCWDRLRDG